MLRLASRALLFVLLAAAVALAPSCASNGNQPGNDAGTSPDVQPVGPCGPGTAIMCGDTCVDTQSDFQNCGSCGNKCPGDQVCSHGACALVCASGTARCSNNSCVDTKVDVNNCGGCGTKCPTGNVCNAGTCALTCQNGLTDCNGDCVDLQQSDGNCGACGSPCAGGQVCSSGKCVATCQEGWTSCGVGDAGATTCADTQHDTSNCGSCGHACPSGQFCSPVNGVGTCGITCMGGTSLCGGSCVDETIDPNNCGACGAACGGSCSGGHCCSAGQVYCGGCDTIANCTVKTGGALAAGGSHTCAINSSGVLKCWGYGVDGQLGDGKAQSSSSPVVPSLPGSAIFVGAGVDHTCAVTAGGAPYCWGFGFDGEIGDGATTERDVPTSVFGLANVTRIDGGGDNGCAVLGGGSLQCWGGDFYGDLGDNDSGNAKSTPVSTSPAITNAVAISAGLAYHACALLSDGTVKCWGENDYGECGNNTTTDFEEDVPVDVVNASNVKLSNVTQIALGNVHSCAIVGANGDVWCWGDDTFGELGDGQTNTMSGVPVQTSITGATAIAAGGEESLWAHTCALIGATGAVECWGSDDYGQLGDGSTSTTPSTTPVTPIASGAVAIAAGSRHTCAMKSDGTVWCWGDNTDGQLGDGTNNPSSTPVQVTGF